MIGAHGRVAKAVKDAGFVYVGGTPIDAQRLCWLLADTAVMASTVIVFGLIQSRRSRGAFSPTAFLLLASAAMMRFVVDLPEIVEAGAPLLKGLDLTSNNVVGTYATILITKPKAYVFQTALYTVVCAAATALSVLVAGSGPGSASIEPAKPTTTGKEGEEKKGEKVPSKKNGAVSAADALITATGTTHSAHALWRLVAGLVTAAGIAALAGWANNNGGATMEQSNALEVCRAASFLVEALAMSLQASRGTGNGRGGERAWMVLRSGAAAVFAGDQLWRLGLKRVLRENGGNILPAVDAWWKTGSWPAPIVAARLFQLSSAIVGTGAAFDAATRWDGVVWAAIGAAAVWAVQESAKNALLAGTFAQMMFLMLTLAMGRWPLYLTVAAASQAWARLA